MRLCVQLINAHLLSGRTALRQSVVSHHSSLIE